MKLLHPLKEYGVLHYVLIFLIENGEILKKHYSSIEGRDRIQPTYYESDVNSLVDAVECMLLDKIDNEES